MTNVTLDCGKVYLRTACKVCAKCQKRAKAKRERREWRERVERNRPSWNDSVKG